MRGEQSVEEEALDHCIQLCFQGKEGILFRSYSRKKLLATSHRRSHIRVLSLLLTVGLRQQASLQARSPGANNSDPPLP